MNPLFHLFSVFSLLSILAVGGGTAVLPEMKRLVVEDQKWLTDDEFRDVYSIGQIAPGPNMLMVILIGDRVDGLPGAFAAFTAFFLPCGVLTFLTARLWNHFEASPWRLAIQRGMAPVVVGLMTAGIIAIARTAIVNITAVALAAAVFGFLYYGRKINPALLILAGGVLGMIFLK